MANPLRTVRDGMTRRMLKIGFMRRWYARRMVAFIERSKKKQRKLPDELARVDALTKRMPKDQKVKTIEEMLVPGQGDNLGRQYRRAAERQARGSGRGKGRSRPGMPPVKQQPKRPAKGLR